MNSSRSKTKIEERLRAIATDLLALNEHPALSRGMTLEEKLDSYSTEWRSLYTEGCAKICRYAMMVFHDRAERHGILLMKIAHDCFKNYNPAGGDFVSYLSHTLSTEFTRTEQKEFVDEMRGGVVLSERSIQMAREFYATVEGMGKNPQNPKVQEWYCKRFGIAPEALREALQTDCDTRVAGETVPVEGGEEFSVFDTLGVFDLNSGYDEERESEYKKAFDKIEAVFQKQQERTKAYTSALVTHCLLKEMERTERSRLFASDLLAPYSFADKEVLAQWRSGGDIGSQKDIAQRFNRDETDASRTMRKFLEKVEKYERKSVK